MSPDAWRARIDDILEAVEKIDGLIGGMEFDHFRDHPSVFPAVLHYLTVIGEAAARAPDDLVQRHPEVQRANMRAQRNFIVHRYSTVEAEYVWRSRIPAAADARGMPASE